MQHPLDYLDRVDEHRFVMCPQYDCCLNQVIAFGWSGWTCSRCFRYKAHREELEKQARKDVPSR